MEVLVVLHVDLGLRGVIAVEVDPPILLFREPEAHVLGLPPLVLPDALHLAAALLLEELFERILAVDAERHGADPHAIVLALHQRLDLGRLSNRRCNHDVDARAVDNDVEGLGQIVGSLLDERLAARLGHLVHIDGDSFVNLRSPDARHMDAGDLNRRFVGTQVLEVILDKVGIAVRTQLEAVGDLAVGPEDVIFLAHDDRSVLRERNAEINESRNGRVRDDGGAECCLRDADGDRARFNGRPLEPHDTAPCVKT